VTDATKFIPRGKAITISDLRVGNAVSITYAKHGDKLIATRIAVSEVAAKQ
jgi:uncharacterized membrane protein